MWPIGDVGLEKRLKQMEEQVTPTEYLEKVGMEQNLRDEEDYGPSLEAASALGPMAYSIRQECDEICDFLTAKNEAYGNSVGDPVCVFSKATPQERMNVRMDDKLSRLVNGHEYPGDDTWLDLIGYLILARVLAKRGELP